MDLCTTPAVDLARLIRSGRYGGDRRLLELAAGIMATGGGSS